MSATVVNVWHNTPNGDVFSEEHGPREHTRAPVVVGDIFHGPPDAKAEMKRNGGSLPNMGFAAQQSEGRVADEGGVYVDQNGDVRLRVGDDLAPEVHRTVEVYDAETEGGGVFLPNYVLAAQRSEGWAADQGRIYVDQNGDVRFGVDDDLAPEARRTVEVYDPVSGAFLLCETDDQGCGSSHSCCVADGRTRPTVGDLGDEEPLCDWSSYELISTFDHMEPHSNVLTTPAHMAIAVALHREIVARAAKQDEAILNSVAGSWRNYGEAEGKLHLVGGGPADSGQGSIDLDALRDALLRTQSRQDQMPELPATAYRSGSPSEGEQ